MNLQRRRSMKLMEKPNETSNDNFKDKQLIIRFSFFIDDGDVRLIVYI